MDTLIAAVRVILSLAVVLGLLWYLQRRIGRSSRIEKTVNPITVIGKRPVGQKAAVVVVEVDGQRLLLGVTDSAVTVLHCAERPPPGEDEFARSLTEAMSSPSAALQPGAGSFAGPASPLRGSILSPTIWKQTAAVLRRAVR